MKEKGLEAARALASAYVQDPDQVKESEMSGLHIVPVYGPGSILIHAAIVDDERTLTKTLCDIDCSEWSVEDRLTIDDVECLICLVGLTPKR